MYETELSVKLHTCVREIDTTRGQNRNPAIQTRIRIILFPRFECCPTSNKPQTKCSGSPWEAQNIKMVRKIHYIGILPAMGVVSPGDGNYISTNTII